MFHPRLLSEIFKKEYTTLNRNSLGSLDQRSAERPPREEAWLTGLGQEQAEEDFEKRREQLLSIRNSLSQLLLESNYDAACNALEEHCRKYPRHPEAYMLLGRVLEYAGKGADALDALRAACFLKPGDTQPRSLLYATQCRLLAQHVVPFQFKVKCYGTTPRFERLSTAVTQDVLDNAVRREQQEAVAHDTFLLSTFGEHIPLQRVLEYYENPDANPNIGLVYPGAKVAADHGESLFLRSNLNNEYSSVPNVSEPHSLIKERLFRVEDVFPFRVLAEQQLSSGTLVATDFPFAVAPLLDPDNPTLFPTCFHCLRERPLIDHAFACPLYPRTCPFVFCSPSCVMRNVNVHRQECRFITSFVFPLAKECGFTPGFVLLVVRALIRAFIERSLRRPESEELRFFFRLHSYEKDEASRRPWVWNCVSALARGLCMFLPLEFRLGMRDDELKQFISVVHTHALPLTYEVPAACLQNAAPVGALGLALCRTVSSLGHSCTPNCTYMYTPEGRVETRTIRPVENGNVLTISYVEDLMLPTALRKNLDSSWSILTCNCRRCQEITEGHRYVRGQRCLRCVRGICNPCAGSLLKSIMSNGSNGALETIPEGWRCTHCGTLNPLDATQCDAIETEASRCLDEVSSLYASGERVRALTLCNKFIQRYDLLLHAHHYLLYSAYVFSAGLLKSRAQPSKALHCLIGALHAAHNVLPVFHHEKIHLYSTYADLLFSTSQATKLSTRQATSYAALESSFSSTEAVWVSIVNAWMTRGRNSFQWTAVIARLRNIARVLNVHTPPCLYQPKLSNFEDTVATVRALLKSPELSSQDIVQLIEKDHQLVVFAASTTNHLEPLLRLSDSETAVWRELECPNLMTGLTALGLAASVGHVPVVRFLLERQADLFASNEWGITPLLAMASRPLSPEDPSLDKRQAEICALLVRHAQQLERIRIEQLNRFVRIPLRRDIIDSASFPFLRYRLLFAKSYRPLGNNTAAHYAAACGKPQLLAQLLHLGLPPDVRNLEYATPLHLAALNGYEEVAKKLLRADCRCDARNYRGQTPLMLACYGLQPRLVELLLSHKADILRRASKTGMTCLHALILGLTRTHTARYLGSDRLKYDTLVSSLAGFNPLARDVTYDAIVTSRRPLPITYLTMPVFEQTSSSLFLFPNELETRLENTTSILELFAQQTPVPRQLFSMRLSVGLTPSELLQRRLEYFYEVHTDAWTKADMPLAGLPPEKRAETRDHWRRLFLRLDLLVQQLDFKWEEAEVSSFSEETQPPSPEPQMFQRQSGGEKAVTKLLKSPFKPEAGLPKPATALPKPAAALLKPGAALPKPATALSKPGAASPKPGAASPKPGAALPKPGAALPKPATALPKPGAALPKPGAALPKPGAVLPKPATALSKPGAAPPKLVAALPKREAELSKPEATLPKSGAALPKPGTALPKPGAKLPKPGADLPKPVADLPKPVADLPKPVADLPKPVADLPKPVADLPKPVADLPKPGAASPKPGAELPKPEATLPKSGAALPKPGTASPKPGAKLPKPGADLPKPVAALPKPGATLPKPSAPLPKPSAPLSKLKASSPKPKTPLPKIEST